MSKKVSHKDSISNQDTCGGPKKAGLAPRSTNFMMGVKRNHHFRGQPFKDDKTSDDYECNKSSADAGSGSGNGLGSGAPVLFPIQYLTSQVLGWGIVYDKDVGNGEGNRWCGGTNIPREPERTYVFPVKDGCGSPPLTSVDGSIESSVLTFFKLNGTKKSYKLDVSPGAQRAPSLTLKSIDSDGTNASVDGLIDSYTGTYTLTLMDNTPETHNQMITMAINQPSENQ